MNLRHERGFLEIRNLFFFRNDGATPLHVAASHSDKMLAAVLVAQGADVNARDNQGEDFQSCFVSLYR